MEVKNTVNNINVYSRKNSGVHGFCIGLYVKSGVLYESEEENGLTHFYEHTVFKSVNNYFGKKLSQYLDRYALDFNGCTYKEFMRFKITGATKNFKSAVPVISSVLKKPNITKNDVDCERKRIKAEMRESEEKTSLHYFSDSVIWNETALKNTICGKIKNLDKTGKERLIAFGEKLFFVGNFFFYVTGNFSDEDLKCLLKELEKTEIYGFDAERKNTAPVPPDFFCRKENIFIKNAVSTYVRIAFDIDTKKYSGFQYDILYDILFKGENSVIFKELSEKTGLIYSFDCLFEQYNNIGNISFSFETKNKDIYKALECVAEALNGLKKDVFEKLEYVKPAYTDNAFLILDNYDDYNWERAYEGHILGLGEKTAEEKIKEYESVKSDDITEMCRQIFKRKNLVLAMKCPKKSTDIEKIKNILRSLDENEVDN